MSWFDNMLDWIGYLFDWNGSPAEKVKKPTMTLEEAEARLKELNNTPHLKELIKPYYGVDSDNLNEFSDKFNGTEFCAKDVFKENKILVHDVEINNFLKFNCDESQTNQDKNYTVKIFYGRDYDYRNSFYNDSTRKLRVVYYDSIKKYALIVTHGYYRHYVSKPYDDWRTLQQEVLTLANIIKLEKEIEELKVKHLEENAWK